MSDSHVGDDQIDDLELPDLGGDEEGDGVDDLGGLDLRVFDDEDDPFDDAVADDVPIDVEISITLEETSAIGDDTLGVETATDHGVSFEEGGESMVDEGRGHAEEGLEEHGDDELGIDPIPREIDDGGIEGLDDPADDRVDIEDFPPLDGHESDDDEETDVGIEIAPPPEMPLDIEDDLT